MKRILHYLIIAVIVFTMSNVHLYEDGSLAFLCLDGCIPFALCNEE